MMLLEIAAQKTQLKPNGAREFVGPCPKCGGVDRFVVWPDKDQGGAWYCRGCDRAGDVSGGDLVAYFRHIEGLNCGEAHRAADQVCTSSTCAMLDSCASSPRKSEGAPRRRRPSPKDTATARNQNKPDFVPSPPTSPAEAWQARALALVEFAHENLLKNKARLDYLAGRGLPLDAVKQYKLGALEQDYFRARAAWGLPQEISGNTGKAKKLWLPAGVVIPRFNAAGEVVYIRVRRDVVEFGPRYYFVPGGGNDIPLINPEAKCFVITEADLDGLACAFAGGEYVGALPLATVSAKPKTAHAVLQQAAALLVALDNDQAGKDGFKFWRDNFPRAAWYPVPSGKDPGEFAQAGGDLGAWIAEGVRKHCPILTLPERTTEKERQAPPPPVATGRYIEGKTEVSGLVFYVARNETEYRAARRDHPRGAVFMVSELAHLKGLTKEAAERFVELKAAFPGSYISESREVVVDQAPVAAVDTSEQLGFEGVA